MEVSTNFGIDYIKTCAFAARHSYIEDMESQLISFEKRLQTKNFKVYWASTEDDLVEMVHDLLPGKYRTKVCFDLPTIPDGFNSSRISKVSIADVENGRQTPNVLFTQADFGIAETGTLAFYDRKSKNCFNTVSNIYVLLDISKLVIKASDLELILYLRSFYQNQKFLPQDLKLLNAPFLKVSENINQDGEKTTQTPVEITVFLYDHGVTQILQDNQLRNALYCIDCGQCKTVCPAYEYDKEYTPIGLVRANCFEHHRSGGNLFSRALLCGNCDQVCPVQIPFTDLIIKEIQLSEPPKKGLLALSKTFERRKKLNKMSGSFFHFFFVRRMYGRNKMLLNYFRKQKEPFFNITRIQETSQDEQ